MTCHTDQRKYGNAEATTTATGFSGTVGKLNGMATMNMPVMIHKIHMGEELTKTGTLLPGFSEAVNEIRYPQVITNCVKCHDGTPGGTPASTTNKFTFTAAQGNNWKAVPNRLACGACHDNVNFTTGVNHVTAGARADDSSCATCHTPAAIDASHLAVTPLNTGSALHVNGGDANTNAAAIASVAKDLPTGAIRVTYDIRKVYRNNSKQPVMEFRMLQDGVRKDLNVFDAAGSVATQELWPNFMGAPSVYFVFAVPQDGIAAPADFNAAANVHLRNLWNGTALTVNAGSGGAGKGTLTGPDGSGYYTATLTGVTIPDNAVMLTGGLGYSYNNTSTLPLTQTNLAKYPVSAATATITANTSTTQYSTMPNKIGGLIVLTPDLQVVASAGAAAGGTGGAYTGRRAIVEDARCNNCHQELGVFNKSSFHAGQRNDGTTCSWCHTPNRASSGWSADSTSFVHAIHAKEMLKTPFSWHRNATTDFSKVTFPGVLNNCEACHKPGTYDFALAANEAAVPNRQVRLVANGKFNRATDTFGAISPRVTADNVFDYGVNFSFNAATGVTTAAAGTTLVNSPITAACFACHDSDQAKLHMESNSGSIYRTRTEALAKPETCLVCHGSGRTADIKVMHSK
ncbi:MAG: OmcA/MtrC family decaheme c-type cytochrome [Rhodocyclaceae bacterium]|nr:OmcA/MtrC family decaheme c-type cytochrome [Rhodocyclaceae bacterium]